MEGKPRYAEIVKSGTWLYDNQVPHEVWIVRQNFDYYYDEGFEDGPEQLNDEGELFQIVFAFQGMVRSVVPAKMSLDEAVSDSEKRLAEHRLIWTNDPLQRLFAPFYSLTEGSNGETGGTTVFKTKVD